MGGMQFIGIMLANLPVGYKVSFQGNHGMRQPNGIVGESFLFKDAVGLIELWQITVVLRVKTGQLFVAIQNALLLFDFRIGLTCLANLFSE